MTAIGSRKVVLTIGGLDYTAEVATAKITSKKSDGGTLTFAEAAAGGKRDYFLDLKFYQDMASAALWRQVWESAGDTVGFVLKAYGNPVLSGYEPHVVGQCVITEPDGDFLGGDADENPSARFWTEVSWKCTERPTLLDE